MRTKQEVIDFLESLVGTEVKCKNNPGLDGQCVTLIKVLMEFLGVPDPYKARGHAKDCITAYLNEGIADKGTGFLSVFSNKNMGDGFGHIWCNAGEGNGTYYESNGAKTLTVTKGKTYSYDNVCNFDKYITMQETVTKEEWQIERDERNKNWDLYQAELEKNKTLTSENEGLKEERDSIKKKYNELIQYIFTKTNPLKPLIDQSEDSARAEIVSLVSNIDILNQEIRDNQNKAEKRESELVHENEVLQGKLDTLQEQFDKMKIKHAQDLEVMQEKIDKVQAQVEANNEAKQENNKFKTWIMDLINKLLKG